MAIRATAVLATALLSGTLVHTAGTPQTLPSDDAAVRHVLNRLAFGPRPGDVERVRAIGLANYIDGQLHPDRIDDAAVDARLQAFTTLTMSSTQLANRYFIPALVERQRRARAAATQTGPDASSAPDMPATPRRQGAPSSPSPAIVMAELTQARLIRAIESERQLQEVLTDFWFNHFNVFVGKGQVRQYLTEYERDAIRPHVLGSFRDLLGAVARSPAMLFYLDNWQSAAEGDSPFVAEMERRLRDPNLSPEVRQRLTTQLQRARQTPQRSRGLNENYARELLELHTIGVDGGYTQQDVIELARVFTGWTIDRPRQGGSFVFRPAMHDTGTKTVLGQAFAPTGQAEGEFALDLLAAHPATARHIARKLAQRFVADEPPAALVERVAAVFLETKGDLRAVTRAVVTSPEFFFSDVRRAKVKTPLEFVVSAVRATGTTMPRVQPLVAALQTLGMPLYGAQPPTGYGMTAADWVNTGALIARMNLAVDLVGSAPMRASVSSLAPDTGAASRRRVIDELIGGVVSDTTAATLARAETPQQLVALALGSPEFQRR